jgi:predicted ferric reductase
MRKWLFILLYFASPLFPIIVTYQANPGRYASNDMLLSMVLGAVAFTWLSWQFIMSARPKMIEVVFGMDKIYRFHGMMAIIALIMVFVHQLIKENIFGENLMTTIGTISMITFIVISVISILLMVSSFVTRIEPFKTIRKIVESLKVFKYAHYRFLHNMTILALILMQIHVLLTSIVKANKLVFGAYMIYFLLGF